MTNPPCVICNGATIPLWDRPRFHFYQAVVIDKVPSHLRETMDLHLHFCPSCLHVFLSPIPTLEQLKKLYTEDYGMYTSPLQSGGLTASTNDPSCVFLIEEIKRRFKKPVRAVDVGGFDGYVLKQIENLASELLVIDGSAVGTAIARDHEIPARTELLDRRLANELRGQFDIVVCRHLIEHVEKPAELLENLSLLLAENGIIFLETPDLPSILQNTLLRTIMLEHLHLFSPHSLLHIARSVRLGMSGLYTPNTLAFVAILEPGHPKAPMFRELDDAPSIRSRAEQFSDHVATVDAALRRMAKTWRNAWIWGASTAGGALFGDYFQQDPECFQGFIDSDPKKRSGHFLAVPQLPIVSPEEAYSRGVETILVATYSVSEVIEDIRNRGWHGVQIYTLDDVLARARSS